MRKYNKKQTSNKKNNYKHININKGIYFTHMVILNIMDQFSYLKWAGCFLSGLKVISDMQKC